MEDGEVRDEIKLYLNCRYVSAPEVMWRLSEYRMHEHSHTIYRLSIHYLINTGFISHQDKRQKLLRGSLLGRRI